MEYFPCVNQQDCRLAETTKGCFEDVHHLYYPRRDYTSGVEKRYRELEENKILVCRDLHNEVHAIEQPPEMPDRDFMLGAIMKAKKGRR